MAKLLNQWLGNGAKEQELTEEMRNVLREIKQERGLCEALVKSARASVGRIQELGDGFLPNRKVELVAQRPDLRIDVAFRFQLAQDAALSDPQAGKGPQRLYFPGLWAAGPCGRKVGGA